MGNTQLQFWNPVKICFLSGEVFQLEDEVKGGAVIVTDAFLYKNGVAGRVGEQMGIKHISYYHEVEPNPSTDTVNRCAEMIRTSKAGTVIGIGGGSSMDVAKAAACLASAGGVITDYIGTGRTFPKRELHLILIPTTAGTGSEVTNVGVFTDSASGAKAPVVCREFYADTAVIYPPFTYTMPPAVTANTGMDAFCHAIEAYWNRNSMPVTDSLAVAAMKLIFDNLPRAFEAPEDRKARQNMCMASLLAGMAFSQTRTTGAHVLSYPLTARYHIPHGVGCAVSLPAFIRISTEGAEEKMKNLAGTLGFDTVNELASAVEGLLKTVQMPVRLHELGAKREELLEIAKEAMNFYPQLSLTPAAMNEQTVLNLLNSIF